MRCVLRVHPRIGDDVLNKCLDVKRSGENEQQSVSRAEDDDWGGDSREQEYGIRSRQIIM